MKQPGWFGAKLVIAGVLASVGIPAFPAVKSAGAKPGIDLLQHPTSGTTPVEIAVGLYITNFVAIEETRESFELGGYLTAKWKDPRLAQPLGDTADKTRERKAARAFRLEELWTPALETANSISHRRTQYSLLADGNGVVTYMERFDAVLSNSYNLKKFPFDTQVLELEIQPFLTTGSEIRFAPQPLPSTGITPDRHAGLAAWQMKELRYKVTGDPLMPAANDAVFQIEVKRRSVFHIWKIFVPLAMMTMIPAVVFWIDAEQFDWMLKIPIMMLLAMIAFGFAIVRDLPRVGYVTFLDTVFLVSFAFCFLCICEIATVFILHRSGRRPRAVTIHTAGRWAYPLAYFCVVLFLAIGFLV